MTTDYLLKKLSRYPIGTYADIIYRQALLNGRNVAFIYGKERVTFAEYNARVNSVVHALKSMGVKKGDVIGILSWNCMEYVYILGAAMKGGFIASPYNPRLQPSELDYLINYSTANTLFVGPELFDMAKQLRAKLPKVKNFISLESSNPGMSYIADLIKANSAEEPDVQVKEKDPVTIIYTSGTTGLPKGALYTQSRFIEDAKINMACLPVKASDRTILALQLFHIAATEFLQIFLFAGASSILVKSFDPVTIMQTINDEKATVIALVPTALAAIFAMPDFEKYDRSSLTRISYMGSPMPVALLKQGIEKLGLIFCQEYGQSESGPLVSILPQEEHKAVYGTAEDQKVLSSCGRPVTGVHVRIVDENDNDLPPGEVGEIIVQSKSIMREYWQKPKETAETIVNGWLHTRDLGYFDEKGNIYIADRKQDMIITGGEHVFPREVEEILYQHPAILEAAVIGVPDAYWVERVHAVVVLKKGTACTSDEIIDFCKQRISRFKAPKSVEFIPELPKSATGKILKTQLRKDYQEKAGGKE
jgi:long-chain acyl-CoA synthetase